MFGLIATALVMAGVTALCASLLPSHRLLAALPPGRHRNGWRIMTAIAVVGAVGFVAYLIAFVDADSGPLDLIVPGICLLGGIFVTLTQRLVSDTAATLQAQRRLLQTAIDNMPQGLLMFDRSARIVARNRRYVEMYGLSPAVVVPGLSFRDLILHRQATGSFTGDVDQYCKALDAEIAGGVGKPWIVETADGRSINIMNRPIATGGWVATHEDITERIQAERRIAHMALHDPLTNLPNRSLFRERLELRLASVLRGEALAVLYLDLDQFKSINDTLGHLVGDILLKGVADRLRGCIREIDTLARLGGDEFAIVQAAIGEPQDVSSLAERIRAAVAPPFDIEGHQIRTDLSVGIAIAPNDGVDADQLLKNADMALYAAKANGRATFQFFEPEMDMQVRARRSLEVDLKNALVSGDFELHYQPIVNLQDGRLCGCEALLRWNHPQRGKVFPDEFITVAEELGLIAPIGEWVLRTACAEAVKWPDEINVAVNLSPVQLMNKNFVEIVVSALAMSRLPASRLELELTEQVFVQETETIRANLDRLRELGVRLTMDDFGVGYCSLNYLRRFPFSKLKIDRSFIKDIPGKTEATAIVRAIASLAHSLGMTTTAEGVETQRQLDEVRASGCTEMQGFFLSAPLSAAELSWLLRPRRLEPKANMA
jgi:diguanylate cyclase (GGDEF)-like protein/PAS domain S-box-containing protein